MYKRARGVSCNGTLSELQRCEKQNKSLIDSTLRVGFKSTDKIDIDVNHKSMLLINNCGANTTKNHNVIKYEKVDALSPTNSIVRM